MRFGNGALGTIEGTVNVFPQNLEETLYVFGENGTAKVGGKSMNAIDVWQFADARPEDESIRGTFEKADNVYGNGHAPLYADVVEAIIGNRQPYVDGEAGKKALEVVLRIYGGLQ